MATRLSGLVSGMDTDTLVSQMMDAHKLKVKRVQDKSTVLTWKQDKWKELNQKIYKLYTDDLNKMQLPSSYSTKKGSSTNENIASVTAGASAAEGSHTLVVKELAKAQFVTGASIKGTTSDSTAKITSKTELTDLGLKVGQTITIGSSEIVIKAGEAGTDDTPATAGTTVQDLVDAAKNAGMNASFDEGLGRFFISSKNSGVDNGFVITAKDRTIVEGDTSGAMTDTQILNALGLDAIDATGKYTNATGNVSKVVAASNSKVYYNNAEIVSNNNELSINGLKISLKGADENQTVTLNVTKDTQAAYDMVKKFINSYNTVLKEMNTLYYANSAKGFDPLSDDEKEAMTEEQIKKWETKIQDSSLRRDTTLGSLIDVMRNKLMGKVTASNGKTYTLSSFGIQTAKDYTEKGLLHIDGDKDDGVSSLNADKLMKALEEDPDTVIDVLSSLSKDLYGAMYNKMKAIPNVRSTMTYYNDKTMIEQQRQYEKQIKVQESKLADIEAKYYKQFSAMETAMAKMQSQSSALAGLLGTNTQ